MGVNLQSLHITAEILSLVAEIDEFKGAWQALGKLAPEQLSSLQKVATIESIGSSTRIEGSKLTDTEVAGLLANLDIKTFANRDEQEVAGYAEVMNLVFQQYQTIPLSESYLQQLHHQLLQYNEKDYWHRGYYKKTSNNVEAFDAAGKSLGIVFETASPFETAMRMTELVNFTRQAFTEKKLHPLLIIGVFVVEFLAIHPFQDGNGRLSRVLTTYLLLRAGYAYVPYSSMEAVVEQGKEAYYLSLRQTQVTLKLESPNWQPWILFFLHALKKQKQRLEHKIAQEKMILTQLPALSQQILELVRSRGRATITDIVAVTNANRNTIKKHLESLTLAGHLQKQGVGKGSWYTSWSG